MQDLCFYNFYNLDDYMSKKGIIYPEDWYRWCKDIMGTKISMFYYEGLPGSLTSEILETALMFNNFLCMADIPGLGVTLCRYRYESEFDEYWKPIYVELLALNGKSLAVHYPYKDIVLVRDNIMDIIPFLTLNGWINKILDFEKTLGILNKLVRFPTILAGDKEQTNMLKQVVKKATEYDGFIIGTKGFKDHLDQFDIKLPVSLMDEYELMEKYKNLAMGSIGIYSIDEKRERIVTTEIQANNDYVDFVYTGMFRERQRFIKECKDKFGIDITLHETYVDNVNDNIAIDKKKAMAMVQADIALEEVKNEGKIEAAKVEGIEAAKIEPKGEPENGKPKG